MPNQTCAKISARLGKGKMYKVADFTESQKSYTPPYETYPRNHTTLACRDETDA